MVYVKHIFNKDSIDEVTIEDIQMLIKNKTEEFLHLDYEQIPMKNVTYEGLAEHISGFLNTSGGVVIFGVSEKTENKRNIPHEITWSKIKKETLENNLYQKIDPWNEDIKIVPITNPDNSKQRIFLVSVPKSKNPPHMANFRYYIRLNFQTKPIGHDQVTAFFKQSYLQKYDLINTVYGPIYNELLSYYLRTRIHMWSITEYSQVKREKYFLLLQDFDLWDYLDEFYSRVEKWNKALHVVRFRLATLINEFASKYFKIEAFSFHPDSSAVEIEIQAESTVQRPGINEAILNRKDPIDFWKEDHPFDKIYRVIYHLRHTYGEDKHKNTTMIIPEDEFKKFYEELENEIEKDELIRYVREEFEELQSMVEGLLEELDSRMQ